MSQKSYITSNAQEQSPQQDLKMANFSSASEKNLLTAEELLDQELDNVISYDQLLILTKAGKIPYVTIGSRRYYRRQTIREWFSEMEKASISPEKSPNATNDLNVLKGGLSA